MAKYRSIVYVQYKDGSKPKGAKVSLQISAGFFGGGFTKNFFTDRNGKVIIEHESKGKATVYVRGNKKGTFKAPGETVVFI